MSKILIAGGDSFTFGSELPDCWPEKHSELTWAALLAKQKNLEYKCVAKEGSGNSTIMRRVIEAVENTNEDIFVAVMWTWPGRIEIKINEYANKLNLFKSLPPTDIEGGWLTISMWNSMSFEDRIKLFNESALKNPAFVRNYKKQCEFEKISGISALADSYFSLASEEHLLYNSASNIFTLQCYLEKKNIDYVFAATTDHLLEIFKKSNIPFVSMIDKSKWLNPDKGMWQWALDNKYEVSAMNHPVAQAHKDWLDAYYKNQ